MSGAGVVIAGGGLAGQRCAETLRARGYDGPVRMVCAEARPPYDRPPLSKEFLSGKRDADDLSLRPPSWHGEHDVDLLTERRAAGLDPRRRSLSLDDGTALPFDRLLIATGGRPRKLDALGGFDNVHVLRDLADADGLRRALRPGAGLAIVGAGLVGLEVAATARALGSHVTVIEAQSTPLAPVLGARLGAWFADMHRAEGVDVRCGVALRAAHGGSAVRELELSDGSRVPCDAVLVGIGMQPAAEWLAGSALDRTGVRTDPAGRTAVPGVWAAGDVAMALDPETGRHERADHWESAARGGVAAGLSMLGLPLPQPAPATFWTDQYGVRIQAVGRPAQGGDLHIDGDMTGRDFSALLIRAGRPVAGVAVARPRDFAALRRALSAPIPDQEAA